MSSLAMNRSSDILTGLGVPAAGELGQTMVRMTLSAIKSFKTDIRAGSSLIFNDLSSLASECEINFETSPVFLMAQRFLLALPTHMPPPELAMDADGEISFDWQGPAGRCFTATLREDGRLSYSARISAVDKDYGTKQFSDAIPEKVIELVQRVTSK